MKHQNRQNHQSKPQQRGAPKTEVTPQLPAHNINKRFFTALGRLLQQPRGNPDVSHAYMRDTWFPKYTSLKPKEDLDGNFLLKIGKEPKTLFIAHYDTVDSSGIVKQKKLMVDPTMTKLFLSTTQGDNEFGAVLGADDGVGCALLACLAEAGVPGQYVWSAEEEHGCIGTKALIASAGDEWFKQFDRVICIDRKDTTEIITHQCGDRGCSNEFAKALSDALGMNHELSDGGVFTDSYELFHLIPECTNLGAGYYSAHTKNEWVNLQYVEALRKKLLAVKWDTLPTKRTPEKKVTWDRRILRDYGFANYEQDSWGYSSDWGNYRTPKLPTTSPKNTSLQELTILLSSYGEVAAQVLDEWGVTDELIDAIYHDINKGR